MKKTHQDVKISRFDVTGEAARVTAAGSARAVAMISAAAKGSGYSGAEEGARGEGCFIKHLQRNVPDSPRLLLI